MSSASDARRIKIKVVDITNSKEYLFNSIDEAAKFIKVDPSYLAKSSKVKSIVRWRYRVER